MATKNCSTVERNSEAQVEKSQKPRPWRRKRYPPVEALLAVQEELGFGFAGPFGLGFAGHYGYFAVAAYFAAVVKFAAAVYFAVAEYFDR